MRPKPLSALVVVEGKTEERFFKAFGDKLGMNLSIHAVCCNVYNLLRWMTLREDGTRIRDVSELTLDIPKLLEEHTNDPNAKAVLRRHYDAFYMIYDCDIQDTGYAAYDSEGNRQEIPDREHLPSIEDRARANMDELKKFLSLLDNEYDSTVGKLYINYPMIESLWDADSFSDPLFQKRVVRLQTLVDGEGYKGIVKSRLLHVERENVDEWETEDFSDLIRMNYLKARQLVADERYHFAQGDILSAQVVKACTQGELCVLNTSVFIPLDQFGDKYPGYCASIVGARSEPELVIVGHAGRDPSSILMAELQGIFHVKKNVSIIVFPDTFCSALPDYRGRIQLFDLKENWAKKAILSKIDNMANWSCCYKKGSLVGTILSIDDALTKAAGKVVFIKP